MRERLLAFPTARAFVPAMIGCTGLPVASIPVERAPRPRGESAYTEWHRARVAAGSMMLALRYRLLATRRAAPATWADPVVRRTGPGLANRH